MCLWNTMSLLGLSWVKRWGSQGGQYWDHLKVPDPRNTHTKWEHAALYRSKVQARFKFELRHTAGHDFKQYASNYHWFKSIRKVQLKFHNHKNVEIRQPLEFPWTNVCNSIIVNFLQDKCRFISVAWQLMDQGNYYVQVSMKRGKSNGIGAKQNVTNFTVNQILEMSSCLPMITIFTIRILQWNFWFEFKTKCQVSSIKPEGKNNF